MVNETKPCDHDWRIAWVPEDGRLPEPASKYYPEFPGLVWCCQCGALKQASRVIANRAQSASVAQRGRGGER